MKGCLGCGSLIDYWLSMLETLALILNTEKNEKGRVWVVIFLRRGSVMDTPC